MISIFWGGKEKRFRQILERNRWITSPGFFFILISYTVLLEARRHQVSVECDVNIHIIAVNGVLPLPLVEPDPDLVIQSQIQHDALTLHDRPLAGLSVKDNFLLIVVHKVQVGLLEVPSVDVDVKEVDPWHVAVELAFEHVEVFVEIDEHRVEDQRLVVFHTVQRLATPHGKGRLRDLAGVSGSTCLAFGAFWSYGSWLPSRSLQTWFPWCTFVSSVTFITCRCRIQGKFNVGTGLF